MTAQEGHATAEQFYEIKTPSGKKHKPPKFPTSKNQKFKHNNK